MNTILTAQFLPRQLLFFHALEKCPVPGINHPKHLAVVRRAFFYQFGGNGQVRLQKSTVYTFHRHFVQQGYPFLQIQHAPHHEPYDGVPVFENLFRSTLRLRYGPFLRSGDVLAPGHSRAECPHQNCAEDQFPHPHYLTNTFRRPLAWSSVFSFIPGTSIFPVINSSFIR